ncbi:MAG: hypothetical protein HYZ45_12700 [Burkholderiales bacterium]|nr:hypothetical protein [Burkholderiales bacterium]
MNGLNSITSSKLFTLSLGILAVLALLAVVLLADMHLQSIPQLQSQAQGLDALAKLILGSADSVVQTASMSAEAAQ